MAELQDHWIAETAERIRKSAQSGQSLQIEGHGSKRFYGQPAGAGQILSTATYAGVVDYDPTELVMVVKCGTPITEVEAVLGQARQMLAFEPPRFGGRGTVGGMVATGLSGPRRLSAGAVKDFVLGLTVLDAQATPLRYGGTVMKNVAGYDVSRLHTGALGTLGLIVDVSLKVLPQPTAQATLLFEMSAQESIDRVNAWGSQPLPISASSWQNGQLHVRLSGAQAAIEHARKTLGGQVLIDAQADQFWRDLRDQTPAFFSVDAASPDTHLWRLSVPTVTPHLQSLLGEQWIEWGGGLRWLKSDQAADTIRAAARHAGGHATLYRAAHQAALTSHGAFAELSPALMKIHHRLKKELDPQRLFNPGRMFAGI